MIVDRVEIDALHEAQLAHKLGYVLWCRLSDGGSEYVVSGVRYRETPGTALNLEVKTIQGWRWPSRCWAVLSEGKPASEPTPVVRQQGLFG